MQIKLTTLSPLLLATGESSAHIDADVKYDRHGLPYISGKTFKGLLRESCIEVCEILKLVNTPHIVGQLFGFTGGMDEKGALKPDGLLKFNNLKVDDYAGVVQSLLSDEDLNPKFVQNYFTTILKQTTLSPDGTAEDGTLRTYRLIKPGKTFTGLIEGGADEYDDILKKAILNLRYIGTRRNRGFGKVKIEVLDTRTDAGESYQLIDNLTDTTAENCCLSFKITLKSPLQISRQIGDQNTTATDKFIPAQVIRGLIAGLLIKENTTGAKPHSGPDFENIILSGKVNYANAFLTVNNVCYKPTPLALGFNKTEPKHERKIYNILQGHPAKPIKGWYNLTADGNLQRRQVNTLFSFHSARKNERTAGRSTENGGAIFYYESMEEDQQFAGTIQADSETLKKIHQLLSDNNGIHRIGRSKTAQYSVVQFSDFTMDESKDERTIPAGSEFYIVFESPVIVYNENGLAVPDKQNLTAALNPPGAETIYEIVDIAASTTWVEGYMGVWKTKTNRENAFAIGTTLLVKSSTEINASRLGRQQIGERQNEGFGNITVPDFPGAFKTLVDKNVDEEPVTGEVVKSAVYQSIRQEFDKQEKENKLKLDAIRKIKGYKLNNNLVYRLREELLKAGSITEWQAFLNDIKDKKAGKNITDSHLWDDLFKLTGAVDWKTALSGYLLKLELRHASILVLTRFYILSGYLLKLELRQ